MSNYLCLPKPPAIRITVAKRNARWDVQLDGLATPLIDFARREDALDYALCIAAKSGDAIVETWDEQGSILSSRNFRRPAAIDAVTEFALTDVAAAPLNHAS